MSNANGLPERYPLGLPAGSVRSILSMMVVGLICALTIMGTTMERTPPIPIPPFLIYLLFLILGSYFSAHGGSMNRRHQKPPLYLPRGSVRVLILVALIATGIWKYTVDAAGWQKQLEETVKFIVAHPYLPFVVLGGFLLGLIVKMIFGRDNQAVLYQDLIGWVSLVATLGMGISMLISLVIQTGVEKPIDMTVFNASLGAVTAFYFGARS